MKKEDVKYCNLEIVWMNPNDLIPYEKNPRITEAAIEPVACSVEQFGWRQPIVADNDKVIISGHVRQLAALKRGWERVPVHIAKDMTPEQAKAYRLADNRTGEMAGWNMEILQLEISELDEMNFSMDDFGFSEIEFAALMKEHDPVTHGKTDPDNVPETPETPISVQGKVYILGNHRLMCGDSTAQADIIKLLSGTQVDLWLTDPPYNVDYTSELGLSIQNDKLSANEFNKLLVKSFTLATAALRPGASYYIFHSDNWGLNFRQAVIAAGMELRQCLIWVKNQSILGRQDYHWMHETCLYGWKKGAPHAWYSDRKQKTVFDIGSPLFIQREDGKYQLQVGNKFYVFEPDAVCTEETTSIIEFPKPLRNPIHPTMKPVELLIYLIKNSTLRDEILLDNFGGSGSSLIAAEQTGRRAFLMELDAHYCDVIRKRWAEFKYGEGCNWQELTPEE